MSEEKELTPRQARFCEEFIVDLNATSAVLRAGYECKTRKTAQVQGSNLMDMPHVRARIQELMDKRSTETGINATTVLQELLKIATSDVAEAFKEDGKLNLVPDMPEKFRRAVAGFKVTEEFEGSGKDRFQIGETKEFKLWDKTKALELIGKHLKLFTEKHEHEHKFTLEDLVAGAAKKDE